MLRFLIAPIGVCEMWMVTPSAWVEGNQAFYMETLWEQIELMVKYDTARLHFMMRCICGRQIHPRTNTPYIFHLPVKYIRQYYNASTRLPERCHAITEVLPL